MNKLIKEALKDIETCASTDDRGEEVYIKYWLRRLYQEGYIDGLEWTIENNKKHGK